jgi:hypothetical protein
MTTKKNAVESLKPSKKEARKQIALKLETALPELRMALGEKKFADRVKKAAKILGEDFALLAAVSDAPVAKKAKASKAAPVKEVKAAKKVKTAKKAAKKATSKKEEVPVAAVEPAKEA